MNSLKRINTSSILMMFARQTQNQNYANNLRLIVKPSLLKTQKRFIDVGINHHNYGMVKEKVTFLEKVILGVIFYVFIMSYPTYVIYMMPTWDRMEHEPGFKDKYYEGRSN